MRQVLLSFFMLLLSVGLFAQSEISFSVDMNDYTGTFTTPYLSGSFNGWSADANPMEDADADGVWTVTVTMATGPQDYKFQVDAWGDQEMLIDGMPCTMTFDDQFVNRIITVDGDATIETVCWNACVSCEEVVEPTTYNVTLSVNMAEYAADYTTVFLSGSFNGWSGDANPMDDTDGDGIWTTTVSMNTGQQDYKFQTDAWTDQEALVDGAPCTATFGEFVNRIVQVAEADVTVDAVCWNSCADCGGGVEPVEGNITVSLNMNEYADAFTTPYLSGAFNGWSADANPLEDADGDGIWTTTVLMGAGQQDYKFQLDAWTAQEMWDEANECTMAFGEMGEFVNRVIDVDGDAAIGTVCWNSCDDCGGGVEPVDGNITLSLNMTDYPGTFTTPYVAGNFNGWSADANPMEDPDADGIWTTTILFAAGPQEYKFQVDAWSDQEMLMEGMPCTMTSGEMNEFTNRIITVDGDASIDLVCWESCADCDGTVEPGSGDITFSVNMNDYAGAFTTVYLSGNFNGWSADANPLEDADGDGVWTTTTFLGPGQQDYKFQLDAWTDQEMWDAANECTMAFGEMGEFINRVVTIDGDATLPTVCWNACEDCDGGQMGAPGDITLSVDMNTYTEPFTTVFLSGSFNGWSGNANPLEDADGDGIWTTTVNMAAGLQDYKFQLDEWTAQESWAEANECTMAFGDMGEFINRIITVDGDATLDVVCWQTCQGCLINVEDIVNSDLIFTLQPTLAQEFTVVKFNQDLNAAAQVYVSDALGKLVYSATAEAFTQQQQINTANWTAGTYFVRVTSENKMAVRRLVITK